MQINSRISLNAIRVFVVTADICSISRAASQLNVSPSAVSHQIKNLEEALGTSLFIRNNNSLKLTDWGSRLFEDASLGIHLIERSIRELDRDLNEFSIKVAVSFAVKWLIPALEDFKEKFPFAKIHISTFNQSSPLQKNDSDMVIAYKRIADIQDGEVEILKDMSRPVISPRLLEKIEYNVIQDICNIPALICTSDNWDWPYWQKQMGIAPGSINFAHSFDSDDSVIHAAVAGLGMVLATPLLTRTEIETKSLVELPFCKPILTGHYYLHVGHRNTVLIEEFKNWLSTSLQNSE